MKRKRKRKYSKDNNKKRKTKKRKIDPERQKFLRERSKKHKKSIEKARIQNKKLKKRGQIRCNKLPYRFSKVKEKTWPNVDGFKNINVCSGSTQIYKNLSPMKLGPIIFKVVDFDGNIKKIKAKNIENLWQASKVWKSDIDDKTKEPKEEWYETRNKYYKDEKAHRHIKKSSGKNINIPLYSLWVNQKTKEVQKLLYLQARGEIYCPIYEKCVKKTKAFKDLNKLIENGYNIQILGYDGYDYEANNITLKECFDDDSRPFGHELALTAILKNEKFW